MNNKIKRSIAAVLAVTAICNPGSPTNMLSDLAAHYTAAAADTSVVSSGTVYSGRTYDKSEDGYILYFETRDERARTLVLLGCKTTRDNVFVEIPETLNGWTVVDIWDDTFRDQERIIGAAIPKTVTRIGSAAFYNCKNMTSISFAPTDSGEYAITSISAHAFRYCEKLNSVSFLESVTDIGRFAFQGCKKLKTIRALRLQSLGKKAFADCTALCSIDLSGSSITEIPDQAFQNASSDPQYYWVPFELKLPPTVTKIGNQAFSNFSRMEQIDLPHVTSIGDSAFENCHDLKTVFTNPELAFVGSKAFLGCDPMTYFVCKNPNASIGSYAFGFAYQGNNIVKKPDFKVWGSRGGGNVKNYAAGNGFAFQNTEKASKNTVQQFINNKCIWTSGNKQEMFCTYDSSANKYSDQRIYIDGHKPYVLQRTQDMPFRGSCYGMAVISALVYNGYLSVSDFAPGYSNIAALNSNCSDFTKSFVNSVWGNCTPDPDYLLSRAGTGVNFCEQDDEMLKRIEYINYGEDIAVIGYSPSDYVEGHAVVCLGMEYRDDADDWNTNRRNPAWENGIMDARILIYDVNENGFSYGKSIYIDFETGKWNWNGNSSEKMKIYYPFYRIELYSKKENYLLNQTHNLASMELINMLLSIRN